jgi:hypothetical protein
VGNASFAPFGASGRFFLLRLLRIWFGSQPLELG